MDRVEVVPLALRSDLGRLESLGDNCELGFVLRRLGCEDGSLFRWSSITPESLLATLRGDLTALYEFDNLVPYRKNMVLDLRYGTAWHSALTSSLQDGKWTFVDDRETRLRIHAGESTKLEHLVRKLRRKFEQPDPIFVIKHNAGIPHGLLESIHYQLFRRVGSGRVTLMEVCADPARAGEVEVLDPTLLRGFVSRFASYETADDGDDVSWRQVLGRALTHRAPIHRLAAGAAEVAPGG